MFAALIKWLSILLVLFLCGIAIVLIGARFADGPIAMVAGGPFTSGTPYVGEEPDWSFLKDAREVEFQLLSPERSRTTWILEHDGKIYIPSGYMQTSWGRLWKQWPLEAEKNGRAILRADGMLYDRQLVRISSGKQLPHIVSEMMRKYRPLIGSIPPEVSNEQAIELGVREVEAGSLWLFEMAPPKSL